MLNLYIYLAVIVGGAAVLAVELLGTRIIAPFYGAGLYLWTAQISVALAALSVGYAIGGRWADRGPKLERFALAIGLAGIWVALIPLMRMPALAISESAGLRTAVLITSTVLFFPPLTLLGMISPYAIRLKAASLDEVGRTAGNLYSVSTVASVFAAIATGFFLIPNIGVTRLLLLIGLELVAVSAVGLILARRARAIATAGVLIAVLAGSFVLAPDLKANPEIGLFDVRQSAYGEIRVVEVNSTRYMVLDGGIHTIIDPNTWDSQFPYVNVLDLAKGLYAEPGEMLLVGLGGGSVVKSFRRDGWTVDAVEIDPEVVEVAYSHFGLFPIEANIYAMDARQYLITHDKKYSLIVMDAFGSSSIPFHLVTKESFSLARSRMTDNGVLAMNIEAVGWDDVIVKSLSATLAEEFEHVTILPIAEPPNEIGNLVLLASNRPLDLREEPPVPHDRFSGEYDRAHAWDNRFTVRPEWGPVLTDDLNPVDIWAERVNLEARKDLHEFFSEKGLSW
jgi:spermidine synthase